MLQAQNHSMVYLPGIHELLFVIGESQALHSLVVRCVHHIIREIDKKLSKTAFCGSVIAENGGEGRIAQGLGQALTECFASSSIVT